jgi:hypothetical protein
MPMPDERNYLAGSSVENGLYERLSPI